MGEDRLCLSESPKMRSAKNSDSFSSKHARIKSMPGSSRPTNSPTLKQYDSSIVKGEHSIQSPRSITFFARQEETKETYEKSENQENLDYLKVEDLTPSIISNLFFYDGSDSDSETVEKHSD